VSGVNDARSRYYDRSDQPFELREDAPVYVISVAAAISGLHAQTLRQYDRLGLVSPGRTSSGQRLYSVRDIEALRQVQRLSNEGVNLEGIKRLLALEKEVVRLQGRVLRLEAEHRSGAVVVWRPQRRPQN
jgi:MerR family transcriptional regulator, heat shock protein HspR